jgi:hypothetical protein
MNLFSSLIDFNNRYIRLTNQADNKNYLAQIFKVLVNKRGFLARHVSAVEIRSRGQLLFFRIIYAFLFDNFKPEFLCALLGVLRKLSLP